MARSYNFYSPIQRAFENFNNSQDRRFNRELDYKQQEQATRLEHERRMAQANDPRQQLAIKRAQHELEPQTISFKDYMPSNMKDKRSVEKYNEFKSYLPSFTEGMGANIREDGVVVDAHNQPLQVPRFQARKVYNRAQFSVAANQNGIAQREREIERLKLQREEEKRKYKTLPPDQMKLRLGGFDTQIEILQKDLDNPKFRLMELNKTRRNFVNLYNKAALDNSDPQFLDALKYKVKNIDEQMEMLLPAKGLKSQLVSVWKEDGGRVIENRVPYTEVGKYTSNGWKEGKPQYQPQYGSKGSNGKKGTITVLQGEKSLNNAMKDSFFMEGKSDAKDYYYNLLEENEGIDPLVAANKARKYFTINEKIDQLNKELETTDNELSELGDEPGFFQLESTWVKEKKAAEERKKELEERRSDFAKQLSDLKGSSGLRRPQISSGTISSGAQWNLPEDEFNSLMDEMEGQGIDTTDADQVDAYIMHYMSNR